MLGIVNMLKKMGKREYIKIQGGENFNFDCLFSAKFSLFQQIDSFDNIL